MSLTKRPIFSDREIARKVTTKTLVGQLISWTGDIHIFVNYLFHSPGEDECKKYVMDTVDRLIFSRRYPLRQQAIVIFAVRWHYYGISVLSVLLLIFLDLHFKICSFECSNRAECLWANTNLSITLFISTIVSC
jgi:hypothetical protein